MCDHVYDSKSKQMLTTLELEKEYAQSILGAVDSALVALNSLNEEYVSVRQKTCALHNACETLLHEQTRLTDNAEAIHEKLSYFQELDSIRARLKNPNLEVNSEQFLALLAKLDSCIEYMANNSQFKARIVINQLRNTLSLSGICCFIVFATRAENKPDKRILPSS